MGRSCVGLLLAALLPACVQAQPAELPPRPSSGWVHDATGTLSAGSISRLNELCDQVAAHPTGQLAVAVIATTGGEVPREFATRVFNAWGVGDRTANDGVLVFVALDDRRAEIVLGDGIDDNHHETIARAIMSDYMIPQFKRGQPEQGILIAADECANALFGLTLPEGRGQLNMGPAPAAQPRRRQQTNPLPWIVGSLLGASGLGVGGLLANRWMRHRTRQCPHCRVPMTRLLEAEDDAHLSDAEAVEERIESVNYDVWSCPTCPHVLKVPYPAWFSGYAKCPNCNSRTKSKTTSTIQAATQHAQGKEEICEYCQHCDYTYTYTNIIPMLSATSSVGSSGGGFGGGVSSGGGASGGW